MIATSYTTYTTRGSIASEPHENHYNYTTEDWKQLIYNGLYNTSCVILQHLFTENSFKEGLHYVYGGIIYFRVFSYDFIHVLLQMLITFDVNGLSFE